MSSTLTNIEMATGVAQAVGSYVAGQYGGSMGQAAATFLLGEASWTASATDLMAKVQNGTATGEDVADLSSRTASALAGLAVLTGSSPVFLTAAGVAGGAYVFYKILPDDVKQELWHGFYKALLDNPLFEPEPIPWGATITDDPNWRPRIYPSTNTAYLAARSWVKKDPLVLDLDGDGLEATPATGPSATLFDYDGDGIRTGTGWIAPDDGIVVMDRNGNGTIDSGGELFGVDTLLANGEHATDGFSALADLDSNHDGLFNASDAAFNQVRVWQDVNQDGISDAGELKTLAQAGIKAIRLNATASGQILPTQNQIAFTGSYDRSDGTSGTAYALNLVDNPFFRQYPDGSIVTDANPFAQQNAPIPLTAEAQDLPDVQGAGQVRELREAASLDSGFAQSLQGVIDAGLQTHDQLMAQMDSLVEQWAETSTMQTSMEQAVGHGYSLHYIPQAVVPSDWRIEA